MGYTLPKELSEAEWKKHKAALATDTGISKKLKALADLAGGYDDQSDDSNKALTAALKKFSADAADAAKTVPAVFPKTKAFLEKMSKAANAAVHAVHKEMTDRWADEIRAEEKKKKTAEHEAREAIVDASEKTYDAFMAALQKHGAVVGIVVGTCIKVKQAFVKDDLAEIQKLLKEKGVDVKLGPLMKLRKSMPANG